MAGLVLSRKERKEIRREQAIERNNAYQKQISTPEGIREYILDTCAITKPIGKKQMAKLNRLLTKKR